MTDDREPEHEAQIDPPAEPVPFSGLWFGRMMPEMWSCDLLPDGRQRWYSNYGGQRLIYPERATGEPPRESEP